MKEFLAHLKLNPFLLEKKLYLQETTNTNQDKAAD